VNGNHIGAGVAQALAFVVAAIVPVMRADAEDASAVDTSRWTCKYCPYEEAGFMLTPNVGFGYV